MRLSLAVAALLPLALAACDAPSVEGNAANASTDASPDRQGLSVSGAVVQLPAVPGRPGAAYFTLHAGDEATRLASVSSDRVERIELHETRMEGNVMRMGPLGDASVAAGQSLVFEQGGRHAMLFGLDPALKAGDTVTLSFTLEPGGTIDTKAQVRAFGGNDGH